jgi:ornithine carbamoyltransferase
MLVERAAALKKTPFEPPGHAAGKMLGLIFEKPSLRTRLSFEAAMAGLGGSSTFLRGKDVGLGVRESVRDFARIVSQYVAALAVRTFAHGKVEELARHASIPIINALSDDAHPCQAMADLLTVHETFGRLDPSIKLVFVGDGNNVARSLAVASALLGVSFLLAAPPDYDFPAAFRARFAEAFPGCPLVVEHDPARAVAGAQVVYTDVWASMGQEDESVVRRSVFAPYQVNAKLFGLADPKAIFLHCLPAHRDEEVTDDVLDSDRSRIIPQAANRLHFQKALLDWLLTDAR